MVMEPYPELLLCLCGCFPMGLLGNWMPLRESCGVPRKGRRLDLFEELMSQVRLM